MVKHHAWAPGYLLQGAMASDWTTLAVALGSSELQRLDVHGTFARWVRVQCQSGGDLRLWEFQVGHGGLTGCDGRGGEFAQVDGVERMWGWE